MRARTSCCLVALALAVSACNSGEDPSPSDAGALTTWDDFCARYNQTYPAVADACGLGPRQMLEQTPLDCTNPSRAIAAGWASFDLAAATRCLDALAAGSCVGAKFNGGNPCDGVVVGQVPEGGSCHIGAFCAEGTFCNMWLQGTCPGACQAYIPAGGSCADGGVCGSGGPCLDGTCQAGTLRTEFGDAGAACVTSVDCATPLHCRHGQCAPYQKLGETCALGEDQCEAYTYCDPGTLHCVLSAGVEGAPCGEVDAGSGTDTGEVDVCRANLDCGIDGVCHALLPGGAACSYDAACASEVCHAGHCLAPCDEP